MNKIKVFQPPIHRHIRFSPTTHTYTYAGRIVPSVTQIIRGAGLMAGLWGTDADRHAAMARGTAVHRAIELMEQDALDPDSVDPIIAPYLAQWREFRTKHPLKIWAMELRVYDWVMEYAGTADIVADVKKGRAVLDIKTGAPEPWHVIQAAAYAHALRIDHYGMVYLTPKNWKFELHNTKNHIAIFRAAFTLYAWIQKQGGGVQMSK